MRSSRRLAAHATTHRVPRIICRRLDKGDHHDIVALAATVFLWLLVSTRYTVDVDALVVHSGPFKWRIERSDITGVIATKSLISSPALSLDRLRVDHASGRKSVLVSPKDRDGFLKAIGPAPGV